MEANEINPPLAEDLLWGAPEIARELGKTTRQVIHLIDAGLIPTSKLGGRVIASKRKLREYVTNLLERSVA